MELTTWFPGYPQSLSQIRRLLRQLSAEEALPAEVRDDIVLASSEAAGYLVGRTGVRELKLRWNSWTDGASVELEVDGIFPNSGHGEQPHEAFPIINAVMNQATVVENLVGRPRTTVKLVKYWQQPAMSARSSSVA